MMETIFKNGLSQSPLKYGAIPTAVYVEAAYCAVYGGSQSPLKYGAIPTIGVEIAGKN